MSPKALNATLLLTIHQPRHSFFSFFHLHLYLLSTPAARHRGLKTLRDTGVQKTELKAGEKEIL